MHKQIILWVLSGIMAVALVVGGIWTAVNFDKIKNGMTGSNIYTAEDLENAHNDGYNKAFTDKDEYISAITNYKDTITIMQDTISQLNTQITNLMNNNGDLQQTITSLQSQKTELQNTVAALTNTVNEKTSAISTLNTQVIGLQSQVALLNAGNENKAAEIESLNLQIESLQTTVSILQNTNSTNLTTIISLNEQVTTLNSSISSLTAQASQNANTISWLGSQITALENSILYYEQLLMNYETADKATVTFMFDGSVYNMQVVTKGTTATVTPPISTAYVIFNGWSIDGINPVNTATYSITQNTVFVALVTYKFDVIFKSDGVVLSSQIVTKNQFAATPANPVKAAALFAGWSIDGVFIIDVANYEITKNMEFIAVWQSVIFEGAYIVSQSNSNPSSLDLNALTGIYLDGKNIEITLYLDMEVFFPPPSRPAEFETTLTLINGNDTYTTINVMGMTVLSVRLNDSTLELKYADGSAYINSITILKIEVV